MALPPGELSPQTAERVFLVSVCAASVLCLNALSLGFPLKIGITLVMAVVLVTTLPGVVEALTNDSLDAIGGWR